jgi:hypothetical protein
MAYISFASANYATIHIFMVLYNRGPACTTEKLEMAVFWIAALCAMMEAAGRHTSETSVGIYKTTQCYNPEGSRLYTRRRKNLKSCEIFSPDAAISCGLYQPRRKTLSNSWQSGFLIWRAQVQILARRPGILTEVFRGFSQSIQANTRTVVNVGHGHLLPSLFQFNIY